MRTPILALRNRRRTKGQHSGLLLQRYLCENATEEGSNSEEKQALLQAAIEASANSGVRELYYAAFTRWQKCLPELTAANELQTVGRVIVGLGSENVLETGIRLHHTYGMPILPGSALKGLAAHYCDQVWGPSEDKFTKGKPYHQLLFGTTDEGGCIVFHDAWYVPNSDNPPLKLDVMTPHHSGWNNVENPAPPTDFDGPVPVPFLSVAGKFYVAVSWCGPGSEQSRNWTDFAHSLIVDALKNWGVGGKTTSGYGRLEAAPPPPPLAPYKGKTNDQIDAVLLDEKTKKGGWRAQIKGFSQAGPVQNSDQVPAEAKPGDAVKLVIASINDREAAFKWTQAAKK